MHFLKEGQKIRAWVYPPPPLIRVMPERKRFFSIEAFPKDASKPYKLQFVAPFPSGAQQPNWDDYPVPPDPLTCTTEAWLPPPTEWSPWSRCSATCGEEGLQTRTRMVTVIGPIDPPGEDSCHLESRRVVRSCRREPCPCPFLPTPWTEWTVCSAR